MAVDSKKIAEQISNAVKNSPAYTQRPEVKKIVDAIKPKENEGALTSTLRREEQPSQDPVGGMVESLRRGDNMEQIPEVPLIELGDIYGIPGNIKSMAEAEKHSGPIDKSKGISFDEDGVATQKIATDRVLGIEGADDYAQYIYDDLNDRLGAASSGTNEGDVYVRNLRAGNAGLNIATGSELNPTDSSDGNPAMFSRRYPKLNTTVEPFKVRIPNYNLEVMSQTLDPEKLAYQIATNIGGKPVTPYVGYTNVGFDITEPWYSTLVKGLGRMPLALVNMTGKATAAIPFIAAALEPVLEAGVNTVFGVDSKTTRDILMRELQSIADDYDSIANPWNEAYDSAVSYLGLKNTSKAGGLATVVGELPTVLGQIGMLYGIGTLAAGAGLSLESKVALTNVVGGAVFGLSQGAEEFEELGRKGVNPIVRFRNAGIGTAGSIALNSLGLLSVFGSKLSAARQFMQNYGKRITAAGFTGGLIGATGEGLTELGDQILQDYVTYNMGDDQAAARLSNRKIAFALGAISGGLVGIPANIRNERIQIAREEIKKAQIKANAPQWLKELDTAVKMIASEGVYTKEQALELLIGMSSPEGQKIIKQKQNDTLMGLLDRMSPEAVAFVKDIGARESAKIIEKINKIDQEAFNAMPDSIDVQTRTMVARAIKAIAPLVEFYGGKFRMPKFVARPGEPMQWDPKTNTLYINTESTGEAIDIMQVQNKGLKTLDPVQRGILHELGHMMDSQLGRGTNYKEFLPAYFEAITKVFGKEKAEAVRAKMPNEADRLSYAKSQKKADKNEKTIDRLTGQINEKNTSEYFAYALGRLGRRIGKAFGFNAAESAQYVDAANALAMTLHIPQITKQLTAYQNAMNTLIKNNDETLAEMAKASGDEGLARKIQDYAAGNVDALTPEEVLAIYNILKSYVGVDGMKVLDDAFKGVSPETFMQRAEREFAQSIKETGDTVGQLQEALKKKGETGQVVGGNDTDINERFLSNARYHFEGRFKISEQYEDIQNAAKKLAAKHLFDSDGSPKIEAEQIDIGEPRDVLDLTGDELVDLLNRINGLDLSLTKKQLGSYGLGYWGDYLDPEMYGLDDDASLRKVYEEVIDVSQILGDMKKPRVSALEKRVAEKPTGADYETDVKNVTDIMKNSGRAPKWFTRMFGGGDMNTALWGMGGQKLVDYFGMIPKMNRATDAATGYMTEFDNIVKKELGFKNNVERDAFMNEASIDSIPVDYMIDPFTGDPTSMNISPLVAMNVYLHSLNPKTRDNMLNTFGGNGEQMQKVIDALTPEQRKYADLMQKFVADKWKQYKKSYEQEGEELDDEPYWPVVEAIHAAMGERKTNSNISRKGDKSYAISMDVDAREVFNTYVQRVAGAENHVYSTIRRMKDLFGYSKNEATDDYPTSQREALSNKMWDNSRRLRGMALQNFGDARRVDQFLELLDDFLARREQTQVGSESFNIAARNLTAGLLQWKPIQFVKNLSNATGYFGGVPEGGQGQYWRDTAWAATHPIEAARYMFEKVPFLRNRFKGQNVDEALTQQTAGDDSLLMNWAKKKKNMSKEGQTIVSNFVALTQAARRLGYTPMLSGDMAANIVGGYGLLKQYESVYGDRAADKFAEFVVNHQTSSNQATRSLLQRRWSRDIRGELTRFATEQVQKAKSIGAAIAQAQRGERTSLSAAKEIASTLSSIIIFSLISAGVIDLFDGDEENDKEVYEAMTREGISAIVGASVIGNSIIAPIVDSLFFGTSGGMGTPASKIVMSDLRKLSKGDLEDAIYDSIGATIPLIGAKTFASEVKGGYRAVTAKNSKELKAGIYQALGRSENYANERAGIKKEK